MLVLSWFYTSYGIHSAIFQSVFMGMQPAVTALIIRAVYRIGNHALHRNPWLWGIAVMAAFAQLLKINFLAILFAAGLIYALAHRKQGYSALILAAGSVAGLLMFGLMGSGADPNLMNSTDALTQHVSPFVLFWSGLKGGLLTFGGAYTAIPFLQHDAVQVGHWMTNSQFLDGLALSGLLPAPLIIFSTFVGYIGGGLLGAILITVAIFAPAFAFTMIGHDYLEHLVNNQSAHAFLDGVTAGVVGLISATALTILRETLTSPHAWIIFCLCLLALFASNAKWIVAGVILAAGLYGIIFL
jgi:chromate transporter